ncbi:MAG TPA: Gfo/Idh/MocA family oxidoreductase [Bryobacteraceae bacterium]|nr:Gfo/Idh/MocA family oxidoreductase [Bryobacteraceae bacterium]
MDTTQLTRRTFVASVAASLATASSYARVAGANDRLRIGVIGCGGMATAHMHALVKMRETDNFDILTVCDIYDKRLGEAAKLTGAKTQKDYRALLDDKNIDYVLIATPEHWHYQMALDAADAGKTIYVEKPMTHTAAQAKKLVAKVKDAGVKLQVGVQGLSDDSYAAAYEYVKSGVLGKVVMAQIDYSRNHVGDFWDYPIDADAQPGVNLDWKAWLGSAPKRAWDPYRYFRWRLYWDYSSGIASDLFVHRVTRIIRALGLTFPERAVATGGKWEFTNSKAEVPDTFNILLDYPGGPTVALVSSMANDTPIDHVLRGHKATLEFTRDGFTIRPQSLFAKELKEVTHQKKGGEDVELHHRNLMNALRHNEPLRCDANIGYYGVVACEMGVEAFRRQKYMRWDTNKQQIVPA